jgi:hypothetical protein
MKFIFLGDRFEAVEHDLGLELANCPVNFKVS